MFTTARSNILVPVVALLSACAGSAYKGLEYDPSNHRAHPPLMRVGETPGDPRATVEIRTYSGAEIREVNGRRVVIGGEYAHRRAGASFTPTDTSLLTKVRERRQEYGKLRGRPGRYELEIGVYSYTLEEDIRDQTARELVAASDTTQRVTLEASAGKYWVTIISVERGGKRVWLPIIHGDDGVNARIVAAPYQRLVGLTRAEARAAVEGAPGFTIRDVIEGSIAKPQEQPRQPSRPVMEALDLLIVPAEK